MKQKKSYRFGMRLRRVISGVLCAVMLCGLVPELSLTGFARAEETQLDWSEEDLQILNDYGIMRGNEEGDMMPDKSVTRAEFVAMVNRSLGYTEKAKKLPFKDVAAGDWFSDDISISYNMGYFTGTTNAAASPQGTLTREQALVLLGRNLMMQPAVGESFSYADTRSFGSWSRGYIEPAVAAGIIDADPTADFNPTKVITRGELAGMLVRTIGTRISDPGLENLGTVDGNVTITTSNVTLRNTTINGDLYLTGGIGLGDVHLDNVVVNGKILDAGAGLSEKGEISVVLNNVTADELVVDSMRNQNISLSTTGTTTIPKTSVRTSAYLDDATSAGYGMLLIEVEGEEKTAVTVSGNIKEVHNKTPKSSLNVGEGIAEKVSVDEAAVGSTVTIGKDARVKELNLDAGIKVDGGGSIDKANINANGATIAQLPDEIVVAPGITATVNKQKMDTAAAVEASSRPRLASGYPVLDNLAPTSVNGLFMTNKTGTVYWAVTAVTDGSPTEEDIISPPTYAKTILKSGKIQVKDSDKEYTAKISGLTSDGSYYLSAILVDERGTRSAMKVTAFTTPDNTTPAFAKGYPAESEITEQNAQFSVMTNKSCNLYFALLPKGSTAPRAIDFRTGSISGNLGYGVVKMEKNNPSNIFVNSVTLEEQQSYVLYLWLNDFDGAKSSAVKAVNFTTLDKTNPIVSNLRQTDTKASAATLSYALSEQGTLYWAVVPAGNETFMSPSANTVTGVPFLETQEAKERVVSGVGALRKGSSAVSAAKAGNDIGFTVSGLNSKTTGTSAYDLYYVAKDKTGNWSDTVGKILIYTLDTNAPKVELRFTSFNEGEDETTKEPLGDTDVKLVFSKAVRVVDKTNGVTQEYPFLDLYQQGKTRELAEALRKHVLLYKVPVSGSPAKARDEVADPINYDINYSLARVYMDGSNMVVEFPYSAISSQSAHHLANGGEYYFELSGIQDTTSNHNPMAKTKLSFKTKQAQINISSPGISELTYLGQELPVDFSFQLDAKATSSSPEDIFYDILLWCDESLSFDLYRRAGTSGEWYPVGSILGEGRVGLFEYTVPSNSSERYRTVNQILKDGNRYPYNALRDLDEDISYQYAVHIKSLGGSNVNRQTWNLDCNMSVTIASGQRADLNNLAGGNGTKTTWETQVKGRVNSIGNPDPYSRQITISDSVAPVLANVYPQFDANDTAATMTFLLDRPGTIYYVVTPVTKTGSGTFANPVPPTFVRGDITDDPETNLIPTSGRGITHTKEDSDEVYLTSPDRDGIISKKITDPSVHQGNISNDGESTCKVNLDNLTANTWYYVYLMFQGNTDPDQAVCYKFKTEEAYNPVLSLSTEGTTKAGNVLATVTRTSANVFARLIPTSSLNNTFYSLKLTGPGTSSNEKELASNFSGQWPTAPEANGYTILSAMMTPASGQNGSVFDAYATDDLKAHVANLIRTGSSGNGVGSIAAKSLTIPMGKDGQMVFDGLAQNLEYFCVAVAENTSNSNKRGFSAVRPVEVVDTNPATVTNASGNLRIVAVEDPANNQTVYILTGTASISYAGYLYVNDGNGTTRPFTQGGSQTEPFFDVTTSAGTTTWAGAASITSINSTGIFEVRPTGGSSVAAMTQTLVLTVVNNLDQYADVLGSLSGVPAEGYVIETRQWKQVTPEGSTTPTWEKPEYPTLSNSILFPTEIVNRNGTTPTNTGSINYTNVSGSKTGSQVSVSYKKK